MSNINLYYLYRLNLLDQLMLSLTFKGDLMYLKWFTSDPARIYFFDKELK